MNLICSILEHLLVSHFTGPANACSLLLCVLDFRVVHSYTNIYIELPPFTSSFSVAMPFSSSPSLALTIHAVSLVNLSVETSVET